MPPNKSNLTRRRFLKVAAVGTGAAGLATVLPETAEARGGSPERLAEEHAGDRALLIDITRCVGCGRCVTACKYENDLGWREDQPAEGPDARLASENYSVVRTAEVRGTNGEPRYVRQQCMHCLDPACASACFVKALRKDVLGMVTYDASICVGCRYCLMACPFGAPSFDWAATFGRVSKCDLCAERAHRGLPTACSEACPTGAITFGRRGELLAEAHRRLREQPDRYVDHVYGEEEVGGTSVLYISDVAFEELGFPAGLPTVPLPTYTWEISRLIPPTATGLGAMLMVLYVRRRYLLRAREAADDRRATEEVEA
jgi:formate dehydrogenase iron-sulfur subunit